MVKGRDKNKKRSSSDSSPHESKALVIGRGRLFPFRRADDSFFRKRAKGHSDYARNSDDLLSQSSSDDLEEVTPVPVKSKATNVERTSASTGSSKNSSASKDRPSKNLTQALECVESGSSTCPNLVPRRADYGTREVISFRSQVTQRLLTQDPQWLFRIAADDFSNLDMTSQASKARFQHDALKRAGLRGEKLEQSKMDTRWNKLVGCKE